MTIIGGNRKDRRTCRSHALVDASIASALKGQPSKRELQEMLAQAVRNTAAGEVEEAQRGEVES